MSHRLETQQEIYKTQSMINYQPQQKEIEMQHNRRSSESSEGIPPPPPPLPAAAIASPSHSPLTPTLLTKTLPPPPPPASSSPISSSSPTDMNTEYLQYLRTLRQQWTDCPSVEIIFKDLSYKIHNAATIADAQSAVARRKRAERSASGTTIASKSEENIPNLAKATADILMSPITLSRKALAAITRAEVPPEEIVTALAPISGTIRPGSMTLILAPPGAGKSTFLRALTGRLNGDSGLSGEVYFNGLTVSECLARGIHVTRLCSYVGQSDISFPVLTVEETLEFARMNGVGDVKLLRKDPATPNTDLEQMDARRSTLLMELLGMMECKDTIIGSDLMRGISGGQKKRAAIGESLMSNARLYALDEVSNGLDSAVTLHIFSALKKACELDSSSVVTALQQITPETYALFDQLILMREGRVIYHGPRLEVGAWLRDVMHVPFIPESLEVAGFLIDLLSDPKQAMEKASVAWKVEMEQEREFDNGGGKMMGGSPPASPSHNQYQQQQQWQSNNAAPSSSAPSSSPFTRTPQELSPLLDITQLMQLSLSSSYGQRVQQEVDTLLQNRNDLSAKTMNVAAWSPYTLSQYGRQFPHSTLTHTLLCSSRQVKLFSRNLPFILPRIINSVLMGLIYGTLYYQLSIKDFDSKIGLIQNGVMFVALANFQELPVAAEAKGVVVRQVDAGFYPPMSYSLAVNAISAPLAMIESVLFGILLYFIPGFVLEADRFFFWLLLLFSSSSAMSQLFRTLTYIAGNADVAPQFNFPVVILFVVFGGFLIPLSKIPEWLLWAYYLSPFSWATDALAINEFGAGAYSDIDPDHPERSLGDSYISAYSLHSGLKWKWGAVLYLWGFYIVLSWISTVVLKYAKPVVPLGAKRALVTAPAAGKKEGSVDQDAVVVEIDADAADIATSSGKSQPSLPSSPLNRRASFQLTSLPFSPATLAWKDIKYTVYVGKEKTPKVLLNHISGYAEPGKLTALMGSSGAGKTTLMDVIAGRKTTGLIEFDSNIFVNGKPKDDTFERITGYVEQTDLHVGTATVKEALEFSAKLRLPVSVTQETRKAFINEVMELVGITSIQNRMIGDVSQPSLSTGQLKLLTVAVELVANPSILFLDEPTTSLDSKSAFRVMRAIKRIAATGRTIVCTIHQPSQEVFEMFDKLLLLRRGGETVYFDDIGKNGDKLVSYLTRVSRNCIPYSQLISPANWMLDVIGLDATSLVLEEEKAVEEKIKEVEETSPNMKNRLRGISLADVPAMGMTRAHAGSIANNGSRPNSGSIATRPYSGSIVGGRPYSGSIVGGRPYSGSMAHGGSIRGRPTSGSIIAHKEMQVLHDDPTVLSSEDEAYFKDVFRQKVAHATRSRASVHERRASAVGLVYTPEKVDDTPIQFSEEWKKSKEAEEAMKEVERYSTPSSHTAASATTQREVYASTSVRLWSVVVRGLLSQWRSPPANVTRCLIMGIIGFFLGAVYYQVRVDSFEGMSALIAGIFLGISLPSSVCCDATVTTFFRQRPVYYRERSVKMYGYMIYSASLTIIEMPYLLLGQFFFLIPFYFMIGLSNDPALFFKFVLVGYIMVVFFHFLITISIAALPNLITAQALQALSMSLCFAFGGLFIKASAIPVGWKWIYYMNPFAKSFIAILLTQLTCENYSPEYVGDDRINGCRMIDVPGAGKVQVYKYASDLLEGSTDSYWPMVGWLLLTIGILRLGSLYLFKTISHLER